jgi:hypothetical protein
VQDLAAASLAYREAAGQAGRAAGIGTWLDF